MRKVICASFVILKEDSSEALLTSAAPGLNCHFFPLRGGPLQAAPTFGAEHTATVPFSLVWVSRESKPGGLLCHLGQPASQNPAWGQGPLVPTPVAHRRQAWNAPEMTSCSSWKFWEKRERWRESTADLPSFRVKLDSGEAFP